MLSGPTVYAKLALKDGTSILMEFVLLSATSVQPGIKPLVLVKHATMDPSFKMEIALLMLILASFQKAIFFAKSGLNKHVLNAQPEVSSMKMDFVLP